VATNLNTVAITGNLTRDPELRSTAGGTSVCGLRVAVNAREKIEGEWTERANYLDVTVWGAQGENCEKYLEKGRGVAVQGRLRWREWEAQDGSKRQNVEIVADQVQFLGGGGRGGGDSNPSSDVPADDADLPAAKAEAGAGVSDAKAGSDADLPF
jgi:single-strand DNA-binding protein